MTPAEPLRPDEDVDHAFWANGVHRLVAVPDRFINHSCDPSAWMKYTGDEIWIIARRAIPIGEEVTLDYLINNSGGDSWALPLRHASLPWDDRQ